MTATTPKFLLPYPVDSDNINKLPDILRQQAEAIEAALAGFDFQGQDTSGLTGRVTSMEVRTANLEKSAPAAVSYNRSSAQTLTSGGINVIANLTPQKTAPGLVTYANNAFKFTYDCIITACISVTWGVRRASWVPADRMFLQFVRNYSGTGNPAAGSDGGRASAINEDNSSATYAGFFAAGDTVTPLAFNNVASQSLTDIRLSMTMQRVI